MRHYTKFTTTMTAQGRSLAPVCEADLVTTGFQLLAPGLIGAWLSASLTPSEVVELLLLAALEPADLEALLGSRSEH